MKTQKNDDSAFERAKQTVETYLASLYDPRSNKNTPQKLLENGLVTSLQFREEEDGLAVVLVLEPGETPLPPNFAKELETNLSLLEGVERAIIVVSIHRPLGSAGRPSSPPIARAPTTGHQPIFTGKLKTKTNNTPSSAAASPSGTSPRPTGAPSGGKANPEGVKHIIAVVSGKGGVGKSTIAANLAVTMARSGLRIGLMDADIYGPSLPTLFGLSDQPEIIEGRIQPIEKYGVKAMSIGLLVAPEKALAWRGPMVMGAVQQLLNDVDWGELDCLIVDTPPGTGDAHLTLLQKFNLAGALLVTTPQLMTAADVRRGVQLFQSLSCPILGLVKNMTAMVLPDGSTVALFPRSDKNALTEGVDIPLLAEIPLYPMLAEASDQGTPVVESAPTYAASQIFTALGASIAEKLGL